tara:strand:+ start:51298 stop:51939 length:642 start_codon:yes stop_codon:yes gene_type:complete
MKTILVAGLLFLLCNPAFGSTTANLGLTLVDSDATFNGKFKHNVEKGKWQSNYEVAYVFKKSDGIEKTNDFYFQFKENYALTDKSYVIGVAQFDYDKFRTAYDTRTVLGAGYGYKILRTEKWKASNEISLAFLKSDSNEMIVRNSFWLTYKFSPNLNFTNKLLYESGNDMYLRNSTDLMYKLTDKISIGVGNTYTDNIETRNIFTINLAIKFQ